MIDKQAKGEIHLILEPSINDYSDTALGLLIRSIPHNLSIAYVDILGKARKLNNFFENLSLNHSFVRNFRKIHFEIFTFKGKDKISKSILPEVEFYSVNEEYFRKSLTGFDIVIFDNYDSNVLKKFTLLNLLSNKSPHQEYFIITSLKNDAEMIRDNSNNFFKIIEKSKKNLNSSKESIISVYGNRPYSSIISIGHLVRNFINKKDVKFIGFDRGDDIFGENLFFMALKKWARENSLYGNFDFVNTGIKRFFDKGYRESIIVEDSKEAKEGLTLLETALRKQSPIIAQGILDVLKLGIIDFNDLENVLGKVKNELVLTGESLDLEVDKISNHLLEIEEVKKSKSKLLRRGFDY